MPIRAILFDLDDTLMPEIAPEREALVSTCELVRPLGVDPAALAKSLSQRASSLWAGWGMADHYRAIGYSHWEGLWGPFEIEDSGLGDLGRWIPDYRERSWGAALGEHGIDNPSLRDSLIRTYRDERLRRMRPFADAVPTLEALSGLPFALVTNGAPAVQMEKLVVAGLDRYFSTVAISGAVGAGKPDAAHFNAALDALGIEPGSTVMVGNSLPRDILGANLLGIPSVWINRNGEVAEGNASPDIELPDLTGLEEAIGRLNGGHR